MKKRSDYSIDEPGNEFDNPFNAVPPPPAAVRSASDGQKQTSAWLIGIPVLIVGLLGLLFLSPLGDAIPFLASFRLNLMKNNFMMTVAQLPGFVWWVLILVGLVLCFVKRGQKPEIRIETAAAGKPGFSLFDNKVERWDAGLKPELADVAVERFNRHRDSCPDAFDTPPGIRLLMVIEDRNSQVGGTTQERIYHWTPREDHYIIEISNVIPGTMRFVMDDNGMVVGYVKIEGEIREVQLKCDRPYPIVRVNRAAETVEKCYITLLGGM